MEQNKQNDVGRAVSGSLKSESLHPIGVWIRVSTEDQARGESPAHHETRARLYAEMKEWPVVRVYDLSGVSGKSVKDHPEAKAMLADVVSGRIRALIFSKLARLARNTRELLDFAAHFQEYGADLVSLDESIDTSTPAGRFFYTLIAAMAEWEREEITERIRASVTVRAQLGKPLGGKTSLGYRWEDGELMIDPKEAPLRRLVFEIFSEERRVKTTARRLNEAGHRTRSGAKFSATTVRRLLADPTAKGVRRANYTGRGKNGSKVVKPESKWVYHPAPAIVSEALWEECNAVLAASRKRQRPPGRKAVQLFGGLTFCGSCGKTMYKPKRMKKYYCERCHTKMPVHDLERVFVEQLKGFFLNPDQIGFHLEQNDQVLGQKRALLASIEAERAEVSREMQKVYRAFIDDELTTEAFGALYRPLSERHEAFATEVPRLRAEIDVIALSNRSAADVAGEARTLYEHWGELTFAEKRAVVETIVERVTISEDEVGFELAFVPATATGSSTTLEPAAPGSETTFSPTSPKEVTKSHRSRRGASPG